MHARAHTNAQTNKQVDMIVPAPLSSDAQTNLSEDFLTQLAHVLANGQIFDIVTNLADGQRLEEQALHKQLLELRADQSGMCVCVCELITYPDCSINRKFFLC